MARHLKTGMAADTAAAEESKVRETVEAILADVAARGDTAVRAHSEKFDDWSPASFRLDAAEIEACLDEVSDQDIADIRFAQTQVRNFATAQKGALTDIEVETMPCGNAAIGRGSMAPNRIVCVPPPLPPVTPIRLGSTSDRLHKKSNARMEFHVCKPRMLCKRSSACVLNNPQLFLSSNPARCLEKPWASCRVICTLST